MNYEYPISKTENEMTKDSDEEKKTTSVDYYERYIFVENHNSSGSVCTIIKEQNKLC